MKSPRFPKILTALLATLLVVSSSTYADSKVQATYYAAPDGSGEIGSLEAPCSLTGVRDLIRKVNRNMTGDIIVNLRGGPYTLDKPFELIESPTTHDSGSNGFKIIYQAYPGETPVISGGIPITGWTLHDPAKNIYQAKVPQGVNSRQFYVDDQRAERARGSLKPEGWTKTTNGWTITDTTMQNWKNSDEIEVVSRSSWKHLRCGIASIRGTEVTMKTPGWINASKTPHPGNPWNGGGTQQINKVWWIENAYELLQNPGQWYMDRKAGFIYYIPLKGQEMAKINAVLPVLETLFDVHGRGYEQRIHDIEFKGLTFKYATWLGPSGDQAYADNQAGVMWVNIPPVSLKTPGNLSFQYASNIEFERNVVAHMGGCAIDFGHGPQKDSIIGNCIYDISGNGIFLGEVDDYAATDPHVWTDGNTIKDNYITQAGAEYEDQVAICTGYSRNLFLDHNEVCDLPYSGISVGWGWSKLGYSYKNIISNNEVHHYMKILDDGGGIYTLGNQGAAKNKTIWSGNYIHDSGHAQGLYADEGSGFMEISSNVITHVGVCWMYMWTKSIHDISVHDNFSDKTNVTDKGTNCLVTNNVMTLKANQIEGAALSIATNSGLEPDYADMKNKIPLPAEVMVNDAETNIIYSGTWMASDGRNLGDYDNDIHGTGANGATASLTFGGSGIDYLTEFNHDEGDVDVWIDGSLVKTVGCESPERRVQQVAYHQSWPQEGKHTLQIEKKSGGFMILDAFRIYHHPTTAAEDQKL